MLFALLQTLPAEDDDFWQTSSGTTSAATFPAPHSLFVKYRDPLRSMVSSDWRSDPHLKSDSPAKLLGHASRRFNLGSGQRIAEALRVPVLYASASDHDARGPPIPLI